MNELTVIRNYVSRLGRILIGTMSVQCPVYVLHLSYQTKDSDPFYPIDWAIMHFIELQPRVNIAYLSWILGMETDFVRYHIEDILKDGGMLTVEEDGIYTITQGGMNKYFSESGERPDVCINDDIVIDGKTLRLLPESLYDGRNRVWLKRGNTESIPHKALFGKEDPSLCNFLTKIEGLSSSDKVKYGLERESHDFQLLGYEPRYLDDIYVVFSYDSNTQKRYKELFFGEKFIQIDSLRDGLGKYLFYIQDGMLHSNGGYENRSEEDIKEYITKFRPEEIKKYFQKRYDIAAIKESDFEYAPEKSIYPLILRVTVSMLERSQRVSQLIVDAHKKIIDVEVEEGGYFCVIVENTIEPLLELSRKIDKWKCEHDGIDYEFVRQYLEGLASWRKDFLILQRYNELEEIDRKRYIKE